jgi:hypothetical protein
LTFRRAFLALLAALTSFLAPAAARAQANPHLMLVSQSSWVTPGGPFELRLRVDPPTAIADLDLAVVAYQRVSSRSGFQRTLDDQGLGSVLGVYSAPVVSLPQEAPGTFVARVTTQDPAKPRDPTLLSLPRDGVYPVRVELRDHSGAALDGFTTHLVFLSPATGPRLGVVLAIPIHAPPTVQPAGTRRGRGTETVAAVAGALEAAPGVNAVVVPTPETLQGVAANPEPAGQAALSALRRVVDRRQLISGTYVPVSLSGLVDNGLAVEANVQVLHGRDVTNQVLHTPVDTTTWLADDTIDDSTLGGLDRLGIRRVVVPDSVLVPLRSQTTLTRPFVLENRDGVTQEAAPGDEGLAAHFTNKTQPALVAHRFLAETAVLYLDQPAAARGVVAVIPRSWAPDQTALREILTGLAQSPVLQPMSLDEYFAQVDIARDSRNVPLVRRLALKDKPASGVEDVAADIRAMRRRLVGFDGVVDPANPLRGGLGERLLVAESTDLRAGAARAAYVRAVRHSLDGALRGIQMPRGRTFSLTARSAQIPLTFRNKTGYPVHAFVTLRADKLQFEDQAGRRVDLVRPNTTERFSVRARTSGTFPVRVRLESPDGSLLIGNTRFTVRSTATSGVGILLSVGAALFLILWWARHIVRGRRAARLLSM